jgi:hypothetical protein
MRLRSKTAQFATARSFVHSETTALSAFETAVVVETDV